MHRGEAALLHRAMETIRQEYPAKCAAMETQLRALSELERENISDPDRAAACFGKLVAELFTLSSADRWSESLQVLGDSLGRFIYLSDALIDLKKDVEKGRYNPLRGHVDPENADAFLPVLRAILGDCTEAFDRLPLVQDAEILKNILYSGVWIPYYMHKRQDKRRERLV